MEVRQKWSISVIFKRTVIVKLTIAYSMPVIMSAYECSTNWYGVEIKCVIYRGESCLFVWV